MRGIYNIFVFLYGFFLKVAALFNSKAKLWVDGRSNIFKKISNTSISSSSIIWVHCASLGEFEQGRPIIEKLVNTYPDHKILLTFFSPSGYEVRKDYELADFVFYLPIDTPQNAKRFVNMVMPKMVIFIKYEFWYNYIDELYRLKIPLIFASVIFRPSQIFFKPWGRWFARQLNKVTFLFVQNSESIELLDKIGIHHTEISGDTRFDRVLQLPDDPSEFPIVKDFKGDSKLVIGGSTWPVGEKILKEVLDNSSIDYKLIIAPHLINSAHIGEIETRFKDYNPILYSDGLAQDFSSSKVLIINSIGVLSLLYRYADIVYVGGGFGVGIHNLLEASTYGIPVLFGPNHKRFREAIDLMDIGGGFPINSTEDCLSIVDKLFSDKNFYCDSASKAKKYVKQNSGATQIVVTKAMEYLIAD